ncbi:MAG: O-acetyl-ADP-ribose deacetylase [Bryobacteraceae bacterium]|nr:O-acetyl-ADP-ribose deacetylase [Bryobacteraceae bacterium]MDW8378252.1 O-acetyl-ADP-ribose deacetylase [Bryobacterales bacterium]
MEKRYSNGKRLQLLQGDITKVSADAIGNAANSGLRGGGGVDGAIHRAGGPAIMAELDRIRAQQGGCPPGQVVVTTAGELPAKFVFHAVGPIYRGGEFGEAQQLASCYRRCLELARQHGVRRLALPSISTGAYGYPLEEASAIAVETVDAYLQQDDSLLETVVFVLFDKASFQAYARALERRMIK